jgi:hypothetical protein
MALPNNQQLKEKFEEKVKENMNQPVGFMVPQSMNERLSKLQTSLGMNRSKVLRLVLESFLDAYEETPTPAQTVSPCSEVMLEQTQDNTCVLPIPDEEAVEEQSIPDTTASAAVQEVASETSPIPTTTPSAAPTAVEAAPTLKEPTTETKFPMNESWAKLLEIPSENPA